MQQTLKEPLRSIGWSIMLLEIKILRSSTVLVILNGSTWNLLLKRTSVVDVHTVSQQNKPKNLLGLFWECSFIYSVDFYIDSVNYTSFQVQPWGTFLATTELFIPLCKSTHPAGSKKWATTFHFQAEK